MGGNLSLFEKFKAKLKRKESTQPVSDGEDHASTTFKQIFTPPAKTSTTKKMTETKKTNQLPVFLTTKPAFSTIAFLLAILFGVINISAVFWYWQVKVNPEISFSAPICENSTQSKVAGAKTETAKELYIDAGGWQEYLNSTYDYKTLFPPTWSAQPYPDNTQIGFFPAGASRGLIYNGDIVIFVHPNPKKLNVKGYYDGKNGPDLFREAAINESVKIGSENGIIFRDIKETVTSTVAAAAHGNYIYEIVDVGNLHQKDNVFKFMLENFKFLK